MKFNNSHEVNTEVFKDTIKWIKDSDELVEAVKNTCNGQFVWRQGDDFPFEVEERTADKSTVIFTSSKRTFEAARSYAYAGKKVAVLNFANNECAGGGVIYGANTQEESLCRCSTLYPCISAPEMIENFYEYHSSLFDSNELDSTGNDDLIYSPDVVVCKTDTPVPERMDKKDWYKVDVITCAAPDLYEFEIDEKKEYQIHLSRITAILTAAKNMGAEVVILGAFGCGAFDNKPEIVSRAASHVLKQFEGIFETVEFAVFATQRDSRNFTEFVRVFGEE